jgi:HSP20 family molecular chaperone IbpA
MSTEQAIPTKTNGTHHEKTFRRRSFTPPVDVYESADEILVVADVPGVSPERLSVRFENDKLTLQAEATELGDVRYERTFRMPPGIDVNAVHAEAKHGTVVIHLPKGDRAKARQIPVKTG